MLGYCPSCYQYVDAVSNVHLIRTYNYDEQELETTAIHCVHCDEQLHLWWFSSEFEPAMATAWIDQDDEEDEEDYEHPDALQMMVNRQNRASRIYDFWSSLYLCCDKKFNECQCAGPISWETARSHVYDKFDSLSDLYEWTENYAMKIQGKDSCMNCADYLNPSCIPLRNALLALVKEELEGEPYHHDPITLCEFYEYDVAADSLNIT